MSIQKGKALISSKLTNRCVYLDQTMHQLTDGDTILFYDIEEFINNVRKKTHKLKMNFDKISKFTIGVYLKINNKEESKIIFTDKKTHKIITRTLHDIDFKHKQEESQNVILPCIYGDYSHMDDDWKNKTGYNDSVNAFNEMKKHFYC